MKILESRVFPEPHSVSEIPEPSEINNGFFDEVDPEPLIQYIFEGESEDSVAEDTAELMEMVGNAGIE